MTYKLPDDQEAPLETIVAPFTDEQVESLVKWQRWGTGRPECPLHRDPSSMVVSTVGIRCVAAGCAHKQDWAYAYILKVNYCVKGAAYAVAGDPKNYVIHTDAEVIDPDYDGEIIPFHCPNCGLDFDVDLR